MSPHHFAREYKNRNRNRWHYNELRIQKELYGKVKVGKLTLLRHSIIKKIKSLKG